MEQFSLVRKHQTHFRFLSKKDGKEKVGRRKGEGKERKKEVAEERRGTEAWPCSSFSVCLLNENLIAQS